MEATRQNLGVSDKVYHAQIIIDAFSKALDSNMCLSKIPIALVAQLTSYQQNLSDIVNAVGEEVPEDLRPSTNYTYTTPPDITSDQAKEIEIVLIEQGVTDSNVDPAFISSVKNRLLKECIPCGLGFPDFDLKGVFQGLLDQIKGFIDILNSVFNNLSPSYCHFAYFLSFLCIPDLVKILALILAKIISLSSGISVGSFGLSMFISGILGTILSSIMSVVFSMVNFASAPVTCLLNSIQGLIDKLPLQSSLARRLSDEEYELLYGEPKPPPETTLVDDGTRLLNKAYVEPTQAYTKKLDDNFKELNTAIVAEFESAAKLIESAAGTIQQTIDDLIGLKNFTECENERNSGNLMSKVEEIMSLVQLANLLSALLNKKVRKATLDELCRYKGMQRDESTTNPIGINDIADIIEDVTGGVVDVIEDDTGTTVGIITNPPTRTNPELLTIWTCNLADFIKENTLDEIITDSVPLAEAELLGPPNLGDPSANTRPIRTIVNARTPIGPGQTRIIFEDNNRPTDIVRQINDIFGYDPLQDKSELNYYSVTKPKTPEEKLTVADLNSSVKQLTGNLGEKQFIINDIKVISNLNISKPLQIKCGTLDNIKNNLDLILGNI